MKLCNGTPEQQDAFLKKFSAIRAAYLNDDIVALKREFDTGIDAGLNMPLVTIRLAESLDTATEDVAGRLLDMLEERHEPAVLATTHENAYA